MIWTALLLGLGGSLHCAGMCSPLALAVTSFNKQVWLNRVLYNTGRVLVYASFGALVASFGSLFNFSSIQSIFSIALGAVLILLGVGTIRSVRIPFLTQFVNKVVLFIKRQFSQQLKEKHAGSLMLAGILNGLLPCGLTYLALSYTLTLRTAYDGFFFMLIFGMGTWPVMLGLPFVMQFAGKYLRLSYAKVTTIMMIAMGALLIGRSLMTHQHIQEPMTITDPVMCD